MAPYIKTFKDFYTKLNNFNEQSIIPWINEEPGQEAGWRLEASGTLFAGFDCVSKLNQFVLCKGNFNNETIEPIEKYEEVLSIRDTIRGNPGDSSDITMMSRTNKKYLLIISSKCLKTEHINDLDIGNMFLNAEKYKKNGYKITYGFLVKNKQKTDDMVLRAQNTSKDLKDIYKREDTIVFDLADIDQAFHKFKSKSFELNSIINKTKSPLDLKMHQHFGVVKTLKLKDKGERNMLWGQVPRSGKSYIIAGCIEKDCIQKERCNYLIITLAPKETLKDLRKLFLCYQEFDDFNTVVLNGDNKNQVPLKDRNIIICSKQFLQGKVSKKTLNIPWLKKMKFSMRFVDESHYGGCSPLAQKTFDYYGGTAFTAFITATYIKPLIDYNISKKCLLLWDLDDINLCKSINEEGNLNRLVEKHGEDIKDSISKYSSAVLIAEYSKFPELQILSWEIKQEAQTRFINLTKNNPYGWSPEACFLPINDNTVDELQNEEENLKLWRFIFGASIQNIPDPEYPDNKVFMKRIESFCRGERSSRFMGGGDFYEEPMIIMAFLPPNNIEKISNATIHLLKKHREFDDYLIISINSRITKHDPKEAIEKARVTARNTHKKGVLVLSGRQCSLGITIPNCDIVLLLNNCESYDLIYQMMFRAMTPAKGKRYGFVVDLNLHRAIKVTFDYSLLIQPGKHSLDAIKHTSRNRIIKFNEDHFTPTVLGIEKGCQTMYDLFLSRAGDTIRYFTKRLIFDTSNLTIEDQEDCDQFWVGRIRETIILNDKHEPTLKSGIERVGQEIQRSPEEIENSHVNYMDILRHIIPLMCLLTIHDQETSYEGMFDTIKKENKLYNIFITQIQSWWGKSISSKLIKRFMCIYTRHMETHQDNVYDIQIIKELFIRAKNNREELSILLDKYLIPQELEKKDAAEITTPHALRQEMLDKIPKEFWESVKKVFEPSAGKGGFIINIIDRFMKGLETVIPNETKRYKTIVEDCLYFSDISPTNIFICKLLIDPENNNYNLNYNEGNTLDLDVTKTTPSWKGVDSFNAIIGNPPYNNKGGIKKGGKNLYIPFTLLSIHLVKKDGYLLFIVPLGVLKTTVFSKKTPVFEKITEHTILSLNINECARHFNVSSTFTYFLMCKNYKKSKTVYDIVSEVKNKTHKIKSLKNFNLNFMPIIPTKETLSILQKCQKENLGLQRIDKTSGVPRDKFLYIKRLDHINHKKPHLKVFIGDKNLKIKGPILYTKYSKNKEFFLKSNVMAFMNIITRFDGVIYHKFLNMFGIDEDVTIESETDLYRFLNFTKKEIKLIQTSV
jgi:hypothetical protein